MGVGLKHCKKSEKNLGHFSIHVRATQLHTQHPNHIVVYVDSSLFDKCVTYEDKTKHFWVFKGTVTSLLNS